MPAPKGHPNYNVDGIGRPKRFTPDFIDLQAIELLKWMEESEDNLFIEDFCRYREFHDSIIHQFVKDNQNFSNAYDKLKSKQKVNLFKGGLTRKYAHPMCALILSHNHNIIAKTEQKLTGSVTDPLGFVFIHVDGNTKDLVTDDDTEKSD